MTVDQLREFLVLSEIGNYQKAADILYISQGTLSRHIISIEKELGVTLFDRESHSNELNAEGRKFLPYAQHIVDLADNSVKEIQAKLQAEEGNLTIAVPHNFSYYKKIMNLLIDFSRSWPNTSINIMESNNSTMKQLLNERKCSFAFCTELGEPTNDNFFHIRFCTDVLSVCLPVSHPLANNQYISFAELKGETFVTATQRGTIYDSFILACKRSGFEPKIVHSLSGNSIYHFVANQLGIAVLLKTPALSAHTEGTTLVDVYPPITVYLNMLYCKETLNKKESCFFDFAKNYEVD